MSLTDSSPLEIAKTASIASRGLAVLPTQARNDALTAVHQALSKAKSSILEANAEDLKIAVKAAADGELSQSVVKRLDLGRSGKYEDMLKGILDVRELEDPSRWSCGLRFRDDAADEPYGRSRRDYVSHGFCCALKMLLTCSFRNQ